ncbi:MAG: hypothetical protein ACK5TO_18045 [Planctomycetaceae bacterium]|jgi:hypothetical protein
MHRPMFLVCLSLVLGGAAPVLVTQVAAQQGAVCCQACQLPPARCACQRPVLRPVVETQYTRRPVVREREEVSTAYRREAVRERVPTTVLEDVTVDEGGYQTVWVPKLTTKQVARTVYQTRTSYRSVPYQVTRRVPEYACEVVPEQVVRYVPESEAQARAAAAYRMDRNLGMGSRTPSAETAYRSGLDLAPDPRFSYSSSPAYGNYGQTPSYAASNEARLRYDEFQPLEGDSENSYGVAGGPSLSVPAPSAAQVWRNRGTLR